MKIFSWVKRSFKRQIIFVLLVMLFIVIGLILSRLYTIKKQELGSILESQVVAMTQILAVTLKNDVRYNNYVELSENLIHIYNSHNKKGSDSDNLFEIIDIAIVDKDGRILAHTNPKEHPLMIKDATIQAREKLFCHTKDHPHCVWDKNDQIHYVKSIMYIGSEAIGTVYMAVNTTVLVASEKRLVQDFIIIISAMLLLLFLFTLFFANWIEKPLQDIANQLKFLGNGGIRFPKLIQREDEFSFIAQSILEADQRIFNQKIELINTQKNLQKQNAVLLLSQETMLKQKDALEKQKELHELVFNNTSSGIMLFDIKAQKVIDCNDMTVSMLKYASKEDVFGKSLCDMSLEVQADGRESKVKIEEMIAFTAKGNNTFFEWQYVDEMGGIFWAEVTLTFIVLEGKDVLYVVSKNINNQKKAEADLSEKQAIMLEQSRYASMGEMIANIAHQWRQPLNALGLILQKVEILFQRDKLDADTLYSNITKSKLLINSMSNTIDDFRDFFKPNKNKEFFLIEEAIEKAYLIVDASFKNNSIEYHLDVEEEGLQLEGYQNELAQVVINLLNNAKDALLERKIEPALVSVNVKKEHNTIVISVCDNAGGIPEPELLKIFEPYFTTKEEGKGTGIGLYMSKTIVEEHMKGKLYVYNTDSGACFIMKFKNH